MMHPAAICSWVASMGYGSLARSNQQLRYPGANEVAVGILIRRLFYRVINAQRINARRAGLHLRL